MSYWIDLEKVVLEGIIKNVKNGPFTATSGIVLPCKNLSSLIDYLTILFRLPKSHYELSGQKCRTKCGRID